MRLRALLAGAAASAVALTAAAQDVVPEEGGRAGPRSRLGTTLVASSSVPPELTTRVPSPRPERAVGSRLPWLHGLRMPDFSVRLTDPVVRQLERIRAPGFWHDSMARWLRRSGRYEVHMRRILREEGVPEDLYSVSLVESGFNPRAKSRAGAVGLWQFMPAAAGRYGLRRDHWVDERYDFERSTRAAARMLRSLRERFGTWELALAAYNMGHYGLLSSIRTYNTNDYWLLWRYECGLPHETRNYVPRVMATAIVGRNLERFGFGDLEREQPVGFELATVSRPTGLAHVARATGVAPEVIRDLNPELRRGMTPAGRGEYTLRIPEGTLARASSKLRTVERDGGELAEHEVKVGESLASLASRYGLSRQDLARLNEMESREPVEPGSYLVVPAAAAGAPPSSGELLAVVPERSFAYPDRRRVFYRAVAGDTLERVAAAFRVSPDQLAEWNDLDPAAALQPDMVLQVFVPTGWEGAGVRHAAEPEVRVLQAGTVELYEEVARMRDRERVLYRVRRGDTVARLSRRFGLTEGLIARINQFGRTERLVAGDEIVLYVQPGALRAAAGPEPRRAAARRGPAAVAPEPAVTVTSPESAAPAAAVLPSAAESAAGGERALASAPERADPTRPAAPADAGPPTRAGPADGASPPPSPADAGTPPEPEVPERAAAEGA